MCCRSVAVQFGVKIFILAVNFDSFSVEVNGVVEILLAVFIVTLILVNLCNCYNKGNEMIFDFNFEMIVAVILQLLRKTKLENFL